MSRESLEVFISNLPAASVSKSWLSVAVLIKTVAPSMGWWRESRTVALKIVGACANRLVVVNNSMAVINCVSLMVWVGQHGKYWEIRGFGCGGDAGNYNRHTFKICIVDDVYNLIVNILMFLICSLL